MIARSMLLAMVLVGCGGAPFELSFASPASDVSPALDAATTLDVAPSLDAGDALGRATLVSANDAQTSPSLDAAHDTHAPAPLDATSETPLALDADALDAAAVPDAPPPPPPAALCCQTASSSAPTSCTTGFVCYASGAGSYGACWNLDDGGQACVFGSEAGPGDPCQTAGACAAGDYCILSDHSSGGYVHPCP